MSTLNRQLMDFLIYDIETAPTHPTLEALREHSEEEADAWVYFHQHRKAWENHFPEETYVQQAGLYSEFNKVICISVGRFIEGGSSDQYDRKIRSFSADTHTDERVVIDKFFTAIHDGGHDGKKLCGFNITGFDNPALARKGIRYQLHLPPQFRSWERKPWESLTFDIMDFWKMGRYSDNPSLNTLTTYFGIESPKTQMHGSEVGMLYHADPDNLSRIVTYCEADVDTTMSLLTKLVHYAL